MRKITDLLSVELESDKGKRLGRVYDIRSHDDAEHGIKVKERTADEIVYGTAGLWEVLGLKKPEVRTIPWSAVMKIEPGKIIVAGEFPDE